MSRLLVVASIAWPLVLGGAVWARQADRRPLWTTVVYAAGSRVCHQLPARSFFSGGVQWPVCGRCAGLYLAAPIGAVLGTLRRRRDIGSPRIILLLSSVPTVLTLVIEHAGIAPLSNGIRAAAALPLGMAVAWTLVHLARPAPWPTGRP